EVPTRARVWVPGAVVAGIVTVALTVPVASAVSVASSTGSDHSTTWTTSPGWNPGSAMLTVPPATTVVGDRVVIASPAGGAAGRVDPVLPGVDVVVEEPGAVVVVVV